MIICKMHALRAAAAAAPGSIRDGFLLQRRWFFRGNDTGYDFPLFSESIEALDRVALEDQRLETVKHVANLVGKADGHILDASRQKDKNLLLGVATMYPGMFNLVVDDEDDDKSVPCVEFTREMEKLHKDEQKVVVSRDELLSVNILRKLLMISKDQQIRLTKLSWVRREFGLPKNFDKDLVQRYRKFFKVVESVRGTVLKLGSWDQNLAVTSREKTLLWNFHVPKTGFNLIQCPLTEEYEFFQELPFPSPYELWQKRGSSLCVAEKRSVSVFHELLSFMPKKRTALPTLSLFRSEMSLPKDPLFYLLRHPGIFYVSRAVEPPIIFLKESFFGGELKFKGPEDFIRDRYLILMQRRPVQS